MVREIKRYFNYIKSQYLGRSGFNFLILYTTSKCNLSCQTCFFHSSLNKDNDLSLPEYQKIAKSLGKISILLLSGGEPFLNENLIEICRAFIESAKIDSLIIPTNGILTEKIIKKTEILLRKFPKASFSINPSLDGLAGFHDNLRGQKGVFDKAISTIKKLSELKKKYQNLQIVVNSVITRDNTDDLKKLMIFLRQFNLDFHAFEIMRGDWRDKNLSLPSLADIKKMHQLILKNRYWYLKKNQAKKNVFFDWLERIIVIGALRYSQFFKEAVLEGKKWSSSCRAGQSIGVVYPNGVFSACELLSSENNLRTADHNLKLVLAASEIKKQIKQAKTHQCDCTHICFIHSAIAFDFKSFFKIIWHYFKSRPIIKDDIL